MTMGRIALLCAVGMMMASCQTLGRWWGTEPGERAVEQLRKDHPLAVPPVDLDPTQPKSLAMKEQ